MIFSILTRLTWCLLVPLLVLYRIRPNQGRTSNTNIQHHSSNKTSHLSLLYTVLYLTLVYKEFFGYLFIETPRTMEDQEAVESVPLTPDLSKDDKKPTEIETKSSLNSHYGHKIGFLSTFSLILNAGVMIYAHLGTSAVIVSSQEPLTPVPTLSPSVSMAPVPIVVDEEEGGAPVEPPEPVGNCDDNDFEIWRTGGKNDRVTMSDYCSKTYDGSGCLFDVSCNQECFQLEYLYSPTCSSCFADLPSCGFRQGCALSCAANSFSDRCAECNVPCTDELAICLGFPEITEEMGEATTNETFSLNETETGNSTLVAESPNTMTYEVIENPPNSCADIDTDNIDEFYEVYVVLFWDSVKTAWENDAKILAVIIIIFSGVWVSLS